MYGLSAKKVAIVERRPFWRGGHIDFSEGLSVHSRQMANSYVNSSTNKYKYIANSCLCIAMRSTHVTSATNLVGTIYNTTSGSYNQGLLQPEVLTTKGSYNQGSYNQGFLQPGILTTRDLTTRGSYIQGFLQPGVIITRASYNQWSYNQGFLQPGVLTTRDSYNHGFLQPGVLQSVVLQPGFLTTRGSYDQGS